MLPSPDLAVIIPCVAPIGRSPLDATLAEVVHSGPDQVLSEFELHWAMGPQTSIVHLLSPRRRRHVGCRVQAFVRMHAPGLPIVHEALVPFLWVHLGPPSVQYILNVEGKALSGKASGMEVNGCTVVVIDLSATDLSFDSLVHMRVGGYRGGPVELEFVPYLRAPSSRPH